MYRNAYAISAKKLMAAALVLVFFLSAFSFMRISLAAPIVTAQVATSTYWKVVDSANTPVSNGQIQVEETTDLKFKLEFESGYSGSFIVTQNSTPVSLNSTTGFYEFNVPLGTGNFSIGVAATSKVTLPASKAGFYTIQAVGSTDVSIGSSFTFKVIVDNAYSSITPKITVDGVLTAHTGLTANEYTYTIPAVNKNITVTINDADYVSSITYSVVIESSSKYTVTQGNSITVGAGASATFEIIPIPVYQGNNAPTVAVNGTTLTGTSITGGWKYTINNVQENKAVTIDTSSWVISPGATTRTVTISQGAGYGVSQVIGSIYNSGVIYYVMDGNTLSFIVTPQSGYDKSSLVVKANNTVLQPANNLYTISNIKENIIVDITINQEGGYSQLTPLSLTDTAGHVTVSGLFTGSPVLTVKDIVSGNSDYNTLYASAGKGVVLGAYDISLASATVYGSLKLKFNVGTLYNGATLWVLHYINGTIERHVVTVTNGAAEITVTSLSPFMVVDPRGTVVTTTTTTSSIGPPRTGDVISIVGAVVIILSAGILMAVRAYRKKQIKV